MAAEIVPQQPSTDDLNAWRQQMMRTILRILSFLGLLTLAAAAYAEFSRGTLANVPYYVAAYAVFLVLALWRRVPYTFHRLFRL